MTGTLESQVQYLLDRRTIEDLITWKFARAIDWIDVPAAKECFHPDARFQYEQVDLAAHDFCEAFAKAAANLKMRYHFIGCAAVAIDGDTASGEAYAIYAATHADEASGQDRDYMVGCRYLTEAARRDGIWRMTALRILFDWSIGQESPAKTASGNTFDRGLTIDHPLYRALANQF